MGYITHTSKLYSWCIKNMSRQFSGMVQSHQGDPFRTRTTFGAQDSTASSGRNACCSR